MKIVHLLCAASVASMSLGAGTGHAETTGHASHVENVSDDVIAAQRAALAAATDGAGYGPQSPRDIDAVEGSNDRAFGAAPDRSVMNLCNIHFHENAEHRGGDFTTYAGNGDGYGYGTGFRYDGELTEAELASFGQPVGVSEHGDLVPGDTIEIHFVHSTAQVVPGPTLAACVTEAIGNPQLRVETVVAVLVNDETATDLTDIAHIEEVDGYYQVPNLPEDLGDAVTYAGSTTGPSYNQTASPFQVTWSVRPEVLKLDIGSVASWLENNPFEEDHAHGVRNLILNLDLLSPIQ
jgi:hypothetical protein